MPDLISIGGIILLIEILFARIQHQWCKIVAMDKLVFLKLGGSLITDKDQPYTLRSDKLNQVTREIKSARSRSPNLHLILGHCSGSFSHHAALQARLTPVIYGDFVLDRRDAIQSRGNVEACQANSHFKRPDILR